MHAQQAIDILSRRGDQVAEALGVKEGPGWRDITGTAHLYIRGALQSLERIADGKHSAEQAALAMGTVGFANKSPNGFLGENSSEAAKIAMKILQAELAGSALSQAVTSQELTLLAKDLQTFTNDIVGQSRTEDADPSLIAFSGALAAANGHYQTLVNAWKAELETGASLKGQPPAPTGP